MAQEAPSNAFILCFYDLVGGEQFVMTICHAEVVMGCTTAAFGKYEAGLLQSTPCIYVFILSINCFTSPFCNKSYQTLEKHESHLIKYEAIIQSIIAIIWYSRSTLVL